jgi:hypothetical protein
MAVLRDRDEAVKQRARFREDECYIPDQRLMTTSHLDRISREDCRTHAVARETRLDRAARRFPDPGGGRKDIEVSGHRGEAAATGASSKPASLLMPSSSVMWMTASPATIVNAALACPTARTISSACRGSRSTSFLIQRFA